MKTITNIFCIVLIIAAFVWIVGCAEVGYLASGFGAGHTQYKINQLEERILVLEARVE